MRSIVLSALTVANMLVIPGMVGWLGWLSFGWPGALGAVVTVVTSSAAGHGLAKVLNRETELLKAGAA
jgi:hypothetical protein